MLKLPGVELKRTLHDPAVVEIGDVDDVSIFGIFRGSFGLVFLHQLSKERDDSAHLG